MLYISAVTPNLGWTPVFATIPHFDHMTLKNGCVLANRFCYLLTACL